MARVRIGLCFVLTLWMAGTRPSAAIRTGSPHSTPWWEAKNFDSIHSAAGQRLALGDLPGLESILERGYQEALQQQIVTAQIAYLTAIGNTRTKRFRYAEAVQSYLDAKALAEAHRDWFNVGLITLNLTGLYEQVWDYDSALTAAEAGRQALDGAGRYKAQLLLQLGRLYAGKKHPHAHATILEGIEAARQQSDIEMEAQGFDLLGGVERQNTRLREAEDALVEAYRLRALHRPWDLRLSWAQLGALRLTQCLEQCLQQCRQKRTADQCPLLDHLLDEAERFTAQALGADVPVGSTRTGYLLHRQLGEILALRGRDNEALAEFRKAVQEAARWRGRVPASNSALVGSNEALDAGVFDAFVERAAAVAFATGDQSLVAESFLAAETNRAASLRETQALAGVWRQKLPDSYWKILGDLRAEDAKLMRAGDSQSSTSERFKLRLTEMESIAGLGFLAPRPENYLARGSLTHFQGGLRESEVFLSFRLGEKESQLWAVTKSRIQLYRLQPEYLLRKAAQEFRTAVMEDQPEAATLGAALYLDLFGQLSAVERAKKCWLLSVEGALFELPFAALVTKNVERRTVILDSTPKAGSQKVQLDSVEFPSAKGTVTYLIEQHSIQLVPGAFFLTGSAPVGSRGRRVMVGDPIYNAADPRLGQSPFLNTGLAGQLNRLPGSAREVEASAREGGGAQLTVLEGGTATVSNFLEAIRSSEITGSSDVSDRGLEVIHLATHVLTPRSGHGQAFVAFSMVAPGAPELLASSDIAILHVPGALVVMTGCASGTGDVVAGAGLQGLAQAWMVAGASNVVATGWPVRDRGGDLVPAFYRNWNHAPAAEALQRTQRQMIASGGWQAAPSHWAAYQVSGGAR